MEKEYKNKNDFVIDISSAEKDSILTDEEIDKIVGEITSFTIDLL